jgi:hypothetical protein
MEINPNMVDAAKKAVSDGSVTDSLKMIPGYAKMFVSYSEHQDIQPIGFFEQDGKRYAVGPKKK